RDTHPDVAAHLRPDRDVAAAMHMAATLTLESLDRTLAGIPWLTFKGPALSEYAHPAAGLRTYHDLDVLVDPLSLREVTDRLIAAGWSVSDLNETLRNPDTPGETHWLSPTGVLVDLH